MGLNDHDLKKYHLSFGNDVSDTHLQTRHDDCGFFSEIFHMKNTYFFSKDNPCCLSGTRTQTAAHYNS